MLAYTLRRLFWFIPVFFVVTAITFWTVRELPGGPFDFAGERELPEYVVRNIERKYNLDRPVWQQYLSYLTDLVHLDFGVSYAYRDREVSELLGLKFVDVQQAEAELALRQTADEIVLVDRGEEHVLSPGDSLTLDDGTNVRYFDGRVTVERRKDILVQLRLKVLSPEERRLALWYRGEWAPLAVGDQLKLADGTRVSREEDTITAVHEGETLELGWTPADRLALTVGGDFVAELREGQRAEVDRQTYVTVRGDVVQMQRQLDLPIKYVLYPQEEGGWEVLAAGLEEPITLQKGGKATLPGDLVVRWRGDCFQASIRRVEMDTNSGFPISATLGIAAMGVALLVGIPLGIVAALRHNSIVDYGATFFAIVGASVPNMVLGPILIWFFALKLNWFNLKWTGSFSNYILPALALGTAMAASITRLTRASLLQVIREDYMRTALAKGLSTRVAVVRHALKNSLIPVVTILGPMFASVVTGAIVTEQVFAIPGMGHFFIDSVGNRDYPVVMATTLIFALLIVLANLAVDLTYGMLDPRIRYS